MTLPKVADQITAKGGDVRAIIIDLTHYRKLHKVIDEIKLRTHIDILVNNAGFDCPGNYHEDWQRAVQRGAWYPCWCPIFSHKVIYAVKCAG